MELKINQTELDKIANQIAKRTEIALNQGIQAAEDQPLDQAVQTVAREMRSAGGDPDLGVIRSILIERGWK
ncbi:MAG: hypothetical protein FWD55_00460 [Propionibacteriaceae bacterium]|nr:hypothetical protein [Propionibacteriaceae bacterium]